MSKIDFLPKDYMQRRAQRRVRALCLGLFLLVGAGVAAGVFITEQRRGTVERMMEDVTAQIDLAQGSLQQLEQVRARRKEVLSKARTSAALIEVLPQSLVIALVSNRLPEGVSLVSYEVQTKEIKPPVDKDQSSKSVKKTSLQTKTKAVPKKTGPPQMKTIIELTGRAQTDLQVARYVEALSESILLSHVDLLYSKELEDEGLVLRDFKVTAQLAPETLASMTKAERNRQFKLATKPTTVIGWLFGTDKQKGSVQ